MRQMLRRLTYLVRQRQIEADLAEEMEFHRAMTGSRAFGNATRAREDSRAIWIWPWLDSTWQDVSYAARNLRRQPGFAAVVTLVLGTVIGLHATLVTVIAGVLLRPWPGIANPSEVVAIWAVGAAGPVAPGGFSFADYALLSDQAQSLSGIAAMTRGDVRVGDGDAARPTGALFVTGNFFELLGVQFAAGRTFNRDEDRLAAPTAVAVLSYRFWQTAFGSEPAVIGRSIRIDGVPFTVVGVASTEFGSAEPSFGTGVFLPISTLPLVHQNDPLARELLQRADLRSLELVGRLAPGATRERAQNDLSTLSHRFLMERDSRLRGIMLTDTAFASHPTRARAAQPMIAAALIATALMLVWLLACANVGNLLLARAAARVREIAVRLSLGASRSRLVRQLVTEGFVVALLAGALGVAIAYELPFVILRVFGGTEAAFPFRISADAVVVGYAIVIAAASSLAFALAPALHVTRTDIASAMNEREAILHGRFPLRGVLLGVQVAVSIILLVSAGLLLRGVQRQSAAFNPGFLVEGVNLASFDLPPGAYDEARKRALVAHVEAALRDRAAGPIDRFGFVSSEPDFIRRGFHGFIRLPGEPGDKARDILFAEASPGYLDTLKIPLLDGRDIATSDAGRPVAVINEAMARELWPDQSPLGKTFVTGGPANGLRARGTTPRAANDGVSLEVIGVMRNAHTHSLGTVPPMYYQPFTNARFVPKLLFRGNTAATSTAITEIAQRFDPAIRVQVVSLSANLEMRLRETRIGPTLAGILGAFALGLATVGMFGVFSYVVRQRTREIGIRMALGAQPSAIVRLVLTGHARAVLWGAAFGGAGAVVASIVLRSRLHGLGPFDPVAYAGVAVILGAAAVGAGYLPARRAIAIDPAAALRHE